MIRSPIAEDYVASRLRQAYCRNLVDTNEKVCAFVKRLRLRYRDCDDYRFYHLLVGSTPTDACVKIDFPNQEIERFVLGLNEGPA